MKGKRTLCLALLVLAACDEKSAPADTTPHIARKKGEGHRESADVGEEEKVSTGKTKSNDRPRNVARRAPTAESAKGEPGKVVSPFSGKLVDVTGKKPGERVQDPAFPEDGSKIFVVPEDLEEKIPVPVARPLPGREGFVISPYNNKIIDVREIPPGTLVADPTYPSAEKKHFRVPEH